MKEESDGVRWDQGGWKVGGWRDWSQSDADWAQWDGEWWVKVGKSSLNARQRRRISRDVRRLIAREQNEVLKLLREMKNAIGRGGGLTDMRGGRSTDGETEKTRGGEDDDDDDEAESRGGK